MTIYTILAYDTRREHEILCEDERMLNRICASRFNYTVIHYKDGEIGYEPNWVVLKIKEITS